MQSPFLRKYGVAAKLDFTLFEIDGVALRTDWTPVAGDVVIMRDEAAESQVTQAAGGADLTTLIADEGKGYSITLALEDMQAARIVLYFVDQDATKVFLDKTIVIETYGHASAQHPFDLGTAMASQTVGTLTNKTGFSLGATGLDSVVMSDPAAVPSITGSVLSGISYLVNLVLSKQITHKTNQEIEVYNQAGSKIAESDISDNGTTFTRDKFGTPD